MSRWFITTAILMIAAVIGMIFGQDVSAFYAAALIAATLADQEREFKNISMNEDDWEY